MTWTAAMLEEKMKPRYLLAELAEISGISPVSIGRAAKRLKKKGKLEYNNSGKRNARLTPEEGAAALNEVKATSGNPNWIKKE